jgi:hypothetical protein
MHDYFMLNVNQNISTIEELQAFCSSSMYSPETNSADVHLVTTLMLVLNTNKFASDVDPSLKQQQVAQMKVFNRLVKDIRTYVTKVRRFDPNFISVCFLFQKEVMPYVDHDLMLALIKRTIEYCPELTPSQLSYACLHSILLHDKSIKNR